MVNPFPALVAALIWAISPIYYRVYLSKLDYISLNFLRTALSSLALFIPAIYFGFNEGVIYGIISGILTLSIGDTLFLIAIKLIGASIAAPVVYTYVLFVQLTAFSVGESIPFTNFISAILIVFGIFLLSKGNEVKPRGRGIIIALLASLMWTLGQDSIKLATNFGLEPISLTFIRNFSAMAVLGSLSLANKRRIQISTLSRRDMIILMIIALSDLSLGSFLYIYSVKVAGIAITTILTSASPFLTQVISRVLGKEAPNIRDIVGGMIIVSALIISVLSL